MTNAAHATAVARADGDEGAAASAASAASDPQTLSPRVAALVAVVLVVHVTLAWHLRTWGITTGDDDAGYLLLARALREGHFRELHDAALPIGAKYPPGYPALLALLSLVTGERIEAFVGLSVVSSVVALWCLFDVARRQWSTPVALIALTLAAINPYVVRNAGRIMSEAPFTALTMFALWATVRHPKSVRMAWVAAVAAVTAALTRSAGVPLLAAIGLVWLGQRRYLRAAIFGAACAATVGAWTVWTIVAPNAKERGLYAADAVGHGGAAPSFAWVMANRLRGNVYQYGVDILPAELPMPSLGGTVADNVIGVAIIAVLLAVGVVGLWRRWRSAALFLVLYGALLAVWAWPVERFIDPLLPLILLTLALGARALGGRLRGAAGWAPVAIVAIAIGGRAVASNRAALAAQARCDRDRPTTSSGCVTPVETAFFEATRFVADSLPPGAIVVTAKPRPFYYYSGHRALNPNFFLWLPPEQVIPRVRDEGAQYVLLTGLGYLTQEFRAIVAGECATFTLVRTFAPTTILLRLRAPDQRDATSSACAVLAPPAGASDGRPGTEP